MITRYKHKEIVWIDLESPTKEEVREVMEEFHIHPMVANELLVPTLRAKVDVYDDYIYLILHFPIISHHHDGKVEQELDFIIGKNFLITTHYTLIDPLHEFSKIFEVNSMLDKSNFGSHAGFLFFYLIRELYQTLSRELDSAGSALMKIEERIFAGDEVRMVKAISGVNRNLLNFTQATRHHKEVLESFEIAGKRLFGDEFSYYLRAIMGEYYKMASILTSYKETLSDLRVTNDSLLTTRTNEIMKVLTIITVVISPLAFVTALFSMNTRYIPLVGAPNDFWVVFGILLGVFFAMIAYFRYKKWF